MNQDSELGPIGLYPRCIHDERRMNDIVCAIHRRVNTKFWIPTEWIDELRDLAQHANKTRIGGLQ